MPPARPTYRPIRDYGLVGDCTSAALVARDGSVDWWSPGRFDAPSVFGALLDRAKGGFFRVGAPGDAEAVAFEYLDVTNVLRSLVRTDGGACEVLDFMPMPTEGRPARLVRLVRGLEGESDVEVVFAPRFDYGRLAPRWGGEGRRVLATGAGQTLVLDAPVPLETTDGAARARFRVPAGESRALVLYHRPFEMPTTPKHPVDDPEAALASTVGFWRTWAGAHDYRGEWAPAVLRSALTLKLLTYSPTGAVVAAPTCSLPEWIGGVRNWDYRFAWVRDAVFAVRALSEVGHKDEAVRMMHWLVHSADPDPAKLRVLYSVAGTEATPERELPYLEGYRASKPVRTGNAAEHQYQLDVYGEIVEGAHACGLLVPHWDHFVKIADYVAEHWRRPDQGIWEMRCPPRNFLFSKAMAWAALDRMAETARLNGLPGDAERWSREAAAVRAEALEKGWDEGLGAFKQSYEVATLDASNLLLSIVGFVAPDDPRMLATLDRTLEGLTVDGLVYRYVDGRDGLPGGEASFTYCTFWLVEALALAGRVAEARDIFERALARATPLGLYAEEIDPASGEHLGNFPQGFPHIGLIRAARRLKEAAAPPRAATTTTATP